ncbi:hypothetical protein E7T06_10100 [Deinococcus sp. Arct2-2]|uniref:hypothetical protein n=1 Tax=Deinococcus sp. Arct2-2 TaxID=2568653 RepID=UPI0010A326EC|nr:hypothetical protein [Deinococcus sp. Arct2-2]THF69846.1 hypothetical protein E7T06_10100 [Deinococcus sp. Arct2-2]
MKLTDALRHQRVLLSEWCAGPSVPAVKRTGGDVQHPTSHLGGHSEAEQARINVALNRTLRREGLAGGIVFAWLDEWFKRNWLFLNLECPADLDPRWLNTLDAEEHYGLITTDPEGESRRCAVPSAGPCPPCRMRRACTPRPLPLRCISRGAPSLAWWICAWTPIRPQATNSK